MMKAVSETVQMPTSALSAAVLLLSLGIGARMVAHTSSCDSNFNLDSVNASAILASDNGTVKAQRGRDEDPAP